MGDIGTHAFNLAEYISGLKVVKLCADVNTIVEGRKLDDDEIIKTISEIEKSINWFDVIEDAINSVIGERESK